VDGIDPINFLRILDRIDVSDVDHHSLVIRANKDAFEFVIGIGVYLLMRHVGRHEDEVPGIGLGREFQPVAPSHTCLAAKHKDHAFQRAMMMYTCLCIGCDRNRAGPDFLCADASMIDRNFAEHPRRLRRIRIELIALNDPHAVVLPAWFLR